MCTSRQRGRHEFEQAGVGGSFVRVQSAALSEDVLLLCDYEAVLCDIKKWVGQGGKATLATRNSLPANAARARRESYVPD